MMNFEISHDKSASKKTLIMPTIFLLDLWQTYKYEKSRSFKPIGSSVWEWQMIL